MQAEPKTFNLKWKLNIKPQPMNQVRKVAKDRSIVYFEERKVLPNTRRILELKVVPFGTVLDSSTTTSHNCEAVLRRARI